MRILITGSCGLIGGEAVEYFGTRGHEIVGVDNNMRREFFGPAGDTLWNLHRVAHNVPNYKHHDTNICDGPVWNFGHEGSDGHDGLSQYVFTGKHFDAIIHCAAQPAHDYATKNPKLDLMVNVQGTQNMLACWKKHSPNAVFIFMSTNKVYDDAVNAFQPQEHKTRYDNILWNGFDESTPVGATNIFGRHKLEADKLVQEVGGIVLRGGCLTGPGHSGVELHGFLSYLVKCLITGTTYKIFGYKGKQVRDNIHSFDVCRAFEEIIKNPRPGEVYNIGGCRENSVSILEAVSLIEKKTGLKAKTEYVEQPRNGDHICYISDMRKFKRDYPDWKITKSLDQTLDEMLIQMYWGKYSDHENTKTYELNEESTVLDVGGYRGQFTDDIVRQYNPHVYVYEPVREFYEDIVRRFKDNPKVVVFNRGLSDQSTSVFLNKQGQNSSEYRGGEGQEQLPPDPVFGVPTIETVQLEDAARAIQEFYHVDLMSINCEGGEFDIVPRLIETGLIRRVENLQVQFHRFYPGADAAREKIREALQNTHVQRFCYPWVWESWKLNS